MRSTQNCVLGLPRKSPKACGSMVRETMPNCDGAIAQLGERLHGMQEVGGSIPPGSTSLRSLRELRLGRPERALS